MDDRPVKIIFNCETGEETIIPLTDEEILEMKESQRQAEELLAARETEEAAKQAARESAIAKLAALGLTEEEAAAIVGV